MGNIDPKTYLTLKPLDQQVAYVYGKKRPEHGYLDPSPPYAEPGRSRDQGRLRAENNRNNPRDPRNQYDNVSQSQRNQRAEHQNVRTTSSGSGSNSQSDLYDARTYGQGRQQNYGGDDDPPPPYKSQESLSRRQ